MNSDQSDYQKRLEAAAEAHAAEVFKNNPNGFHCAPYVNADSLNEAFMACASFVQANPPDEWLALVDALNKIADPRLRDHREPDAYTELGCVMHIAEEALANFQKTRGGGG